MAALNALAFYLKNSLPRLCLCPALLLSFLQLLFIGPLLLFELAGALFLTLLILAFLLLADLGGSFWFFGGGWGGLRGDGWWSGDDSGGGVLHDDGGVAGNAVCLSCERIEMVVSEGRIVAEGSVMASTSPAFSSIVSWIAASSGLATVVSCSVGSSSSMEAASMRSRRRATTWEVVSP